jgi:hypothetical protein
MRNLLDEQKEKRLKGELSSENLTDLQTLLEKYITLSEKDSLPLEEYPVEHGTRIELLNLNPVLDDLLNKFDDLAKYLREVVPLRFDKKFKWSELIENKISSTCLDHNAVFELINLKLQVGSQIETLYRPYKDSDFNYNKPRDPEFVEIRDGNVFLGVAWGCLNSYDEATKGKQIRIANKELRGFLLKKQGFSIGKRENFAKYFGTSNAHFDRYSGEIIVVNENILPNASRNDLEVSELRNKFFFQIQTKVAPYFISISDKYQENEKAKEVLREKGNTLKEILVRFNPNEDNYNNLLPLMNSISSVINDVEKKVKKLPTDDDKKEAHNLLDSAKKLDREIKIRFQNIVDKKKKNKSSPKLTNSADNRTDIAKSLTNYVAEESIPKFENLIDVVEYLDIEYSDKMRELIYLINENFVAAISENKAHYYTLLNDLKNDFENL